jgi:hypothetical protein
VAGGGAAAGSPPATHSPAGAAPSSPAAASPGGAAHAAALPALPGSRPKSTVLLSFDVEEFDIPREYGQEIPHEEQLDVATRGLCSVLALLEELDLRATLFTTAAFARHQPRLIREAARRHEIASHGWTHDEWSDQDPERSRLLLEEIAGRPVLGFRRPRFAATSHGLIRKAGYRYNASENPIWLPGRYNGLSSPRRPYLSDDLLNIPASATPWIRFPLFWLAFKNVPGMIFRPATRVTLWADGVINLYFHPWELVDLSSYRLPGYVRRHHGPPMQRRLKDYLRWLRERAEFITFSEFDRRFRQALTPSNGNGAEEVPPPRSGEAGHG